MFWKKENPQHEMIIDDKDVVNTIEKYILSDELSKNVRKIWSSTLNSYFKLNYGDKIAYNECLSNLVAESLDPIAIVDRYIDQYIEDDPKRVMEKINRFIAKYGGTPPPIPDVRKVDPSESPRKVQASKDLSYFNLEHEFSISNIEPSISAKMKLISNVGYYMYVDDNSEVFLSPPIINHMNTILNFRNDSVKLAKDTRDRKMYREFTEDDDDDNSVESLIGSLELYLGISYDNNPLIGIHLDNRSPAYRFKIYKYNNNDGTWYKLTDESIIKDYYPSLKKGIYHMQYIEGTNIYIGQICNDETNPYIKI